ncbi:MAG: biosynthetic-type acetolactate synthase large subunit [Clostridia bacterium]|nr:biosynthetic-type acetolactate synthase large subunit [Clostridia bacterium]
MKMKGARVILECLKEQKVDTVFGYPGGAVLPIYDEFYDFEGIKHILTAHEQGATHAADGYARATGKVGVVFTTSGPGATNAVTGIATAYMDSVPLVVFTGQVALSLLGKDSFQEVDITGITVPITKHNYIVKDASKLPEIIREAFDIARSGRPGPVLIDVPKDIQGAEIDYVPCEVDTSFKTYDKYNRYYTDGELHERCVKNAMEAINSSEKPVIYAGGGVKISCAQQQLKEFAEKINAPVMCSLMGLGGFPGDHPLYLGMVGMHGTKYSNYAVYESDLIIAVGARFSDRVISKVEKFAPSAKIMHIDIDPAELGKNIDVDYPINGDVKEILERLNVEVCAKNNIEWNKRIEGWKNRYPLRVIENGALKPQYIVQKIYELTKDYGIVTTEVGQNQIWAGQYFNYSRPRTFISSGGLGTMGYGLGASIGAQIGCPDNRVINIAGDGSFRMNCNELSTISKYKLPIIQVVLNNGSLGMVRQWQELFYQGRFSSTTLGHEVDFIKLADAYDIKAKRITQNQEVEPVLKEALSANEPILIECLIDKDEKVFPIVPPGAPIKDIIEE